ncbi:MAG TPA: acetyl-CoA carboxylase biotin carboxylase subunit, partial [Deltaproteobacteria bacterium]|nr:acetyl-CoA carboxylase biotin carboxylase subunit [Deltaproteobacteria bacterium]
QKVIEEAPAPDIDPHLREQVADACVKACIDIDYIGAGTFEFLYEDGGFYFIEMNTRIQVEHPITEMVTGVDLVKTMIQSAAGQPLTFGQEDIQMRGHAIECRINAEDPVTFAPAPGRITGYHEPGGYGVRVDSWVHDRARVLPFYDSLLAKLIAWGEDRDEAIARMRWALDEYVVEGIRTTVPFHQKVLRDEVFLSGDLDTGFIDRMLG